MKSLLTLFISIHLISCHNDTISTNNLVIQGIPSSENDNVTIKLRNIQNKPVILMGKVLPENLHHDEGHTIRDLYIEDVPGSKSYWPGPWVEVISVGGIPRFFIIPGYNRFYVNAAWKTHFEYVLSSGEYDFYGPFEGKPSNHFKFTPDKPTPNIDKTK